MFDWRGFLDQNRIPYVTDGANVPRGAIGIKCPFCGEADPSEHMVLRPSYWRCWRDRAHSGKHPAWLVQALLSCSLARAYDLTASSHGPAMASDLEAQIAANLGTDEPGSEIVIPCPRWPKEFRRFRDEYAAQPFLDYLSKRGFHKLALKPKLITDKYKLSYCISGPFRGRIIFPVIKDGQLISWTGRSIYPNERHRYMSLTTDKDKARDLRVDAAQAPLNNALLWQDDLQSASGRLVIVEGPFDALKVRVLGEPDGIHATCLFTSTPTAKQVSIIRELAPRFHDVRILLDEDARVKTLTIKSQLSALGIKGAWLSRGDPGDIQTRDDLLNLITDR